MRSIEFKVDSIILALFCKITTCVNDKRMNTFMNAQCECVDKLVSKNDADYLNLLYSIYQRRETIRICITEFLTGFMGHAEENVNEGQYLKVAKFSKDVHDLCMALIDFCKNWDYYLTVSCNIIDEKTISVFAVRFST